MLCAWLVASVARADAVPDLPEPRCEAGYVVAHGHMGPHCARPSCDVTGDCPEGLLCTPRRCLASVRVPECSYGAPSGAKEPPDPCAAIEDRGPCSATTACGAGEWCNPGTCLPLDEHAAVVASLPPVRTTGEETEPGDPAPAEPTPGDPGPARRPDAPSGGGCCGSRGARSSAAALLVPLALGLVLAHRRR